MGSALGMTLDWARLCFSSVIQVTHSMVPVPSGVRRCPTHWPNGTALCQHVSVCMYVHPHTSVYTILPPAAGEDLWCGHQLWPDDQAAMEALFQNIVSCLCKEAYLYTVLLLSGGHLVSPYFYMVYFFQKSLLLALYICLWLLQIFNQ